MQGRSHITGVDAQQAATIERAKRRHRQIEIVYGVGDETASPEQRLPAAIGPLPIESRRGRERVAGIDAAQRRDVGIGIVKERGERKNRTRTSKLLCANEGQLQRA